VTGFGFATMKKLKAETDLAEHQRRRTEWTSRWNKTKGKMNYNHSIKLRQVSVNLLKWQNEQITVELAADNRF